MSTRFLVDEDVNQKAIRAIPTNSKGFEILYPGSGSYRGAADSAVWRLAAQLDSVFVTRDKDFHHQGLGPKDFPHGVIWLRPHRSSQRNIGDALAHFCRLIQRVYPTNPYDFSGRIFEIHPDRVVIHNLDGEATTFLFE
jgi:predicted nuclease of predicted toxin-antitoxin system